MDFLASNITFLKKKKGITQTDISLQVNKGVSAISAWEKKISEPGILELQILSNYFVVSIDDLINTDLSNAQLNQTNDTSKKRANAQLNAQGNAQLKPKKQEGQGGFTINVVGNSTSKMHPIPVTDLSVAAGGGIYNEEHIDISESILLPPSLLRPGHTYLCGKIKGISMAPTLQDGGYVVIRLLDKAEWAKMPDERIFVVIDNDNKAYLKRVKNRFKQGFIVLRSDSPDSATFPSFNLTHDEISMIWYVEWYFSAKMPNIHDQYYSRLQALEDKVDNLEGKLPKINHK